MFHDFFESINFLYFFISAVLFIIGINLGPEVVNRDIRWLLAYPRWMKKMMERFFLKKRNFFLLFVTIFLLNNLSLFSSFISGFLLIFPPLAAFFTGLNVSILSYDMMGWKGIWKILVNPVAWLEFPAAWISFSLGFRLAEAQWTHHNFYYAYKVFLSLLPVYVTLVGGLLFVAALLESGLIVLTEIMKDKTDED